MFLYLIAGIVVGFGVSFLTLKSSLSKSGAGNCKMCVSCPHKLKGDKNNENAM